ncbi:hypothetical protein QQX98_000654 [Neonectria punicea]|uniref:Branched-chain-amino-acid aminotransferase n=1 Tax=Neonectria punicea TaxID=979145 RepID=A0ABR1HSB0_9HYPO
MLVVNWKKTDGWSKPVIQPYGNISLPPTASVLHYGTECFEGLKAYRGYDNKLRLFRPELNCARLRTSALRVGLPDIDPLELGKLIQSFLAVDGKRWLPDPGTFLYVRPAVIGTSAALGVTRPTEAMLFVVAVLFPQFGQSGPGLKLQCSSGQVRAWPGGFGNTKLGANYGPTLVSQENANNEGFIQVLWLFGPDDNVTEAGASNFFVILRNKESGELELVTPPLGDIILDGITRRSVLELAQEKFVDGSKDLGDLQGLKVCERPITMSELVLASEEGRLLEAFMTGTAFFISPVSTIRYHGVNIEIGKKDGEGRVIAPYATGLKGCLKDIMYGNENHKWAQIIQE